MSERVSEHDQLENSVAAYVLGASEPREEEEVSAHLGACAACRQLAQRLGGVVGSLPLGTEEVKPPARLRQSILAAAAATPRPVSQPPVRRRVVRLPGARQSWSLPAFTFDYQRAVAVLAVCVIGLGAWNLALTGQLQQSSASHYALKGSGPMAGVQASVTSFKRDGVVLVDFRQMPPLASGRVYELWLIGADGRPVPGAVFSPEPDGSRVVLLNRDMSGVRQLAVTVEVGPAGASSPSQSPQLAGQVA